MVDLMIHTDARYGALFALLSQSAILAESLVKAVILKTVSNGIVLTKQFKTTSYRQAVPQTASTNTITFRLMLQYRVTK